MLHDSNLTLETLFYRSDYVYAERFPKKLNVYISGNIAWTINNLCTLLNELPDLMNTKHSFIKRKCKKKPMIIFHFENPENNEFYLFIKITDKITVQVSTYWIKDKWNLEDKKFESDIGSNNRIINKEKMQKHIRFTTTFQNISESSLFFLNNCSLLYFSKYNFSKILHFFVKRVYLVRQPIDSDFESVDNYVRNFCEGSQKKFNSFEDIKDFGIKGYIVLNIQKKINERRLQTYVYHNKEYYIKSGVYLFPHSKSLLSNANVEVRGFMLDTTWRIMSFYTTSILTACVSNSSLPIGFVFGRGETKKIYNFLIKTAEKQFNFSFKKKSLKVTKDPHLKVYATI